MHFCNATRTFYEVKCSASHFPKENVQHHIFQRKMFSITFSKGKCSASHFPKENVQHQQNVRVAPNTFLHSNTIAVGTGNCEELNKKIVR